jgi:hypothetical protein
MLTSDIVEQILYDANLSLASKVTELWHAQLHLRPADYDRLARIKELFVLRGERAIGDADFGFVDRLHRQIFGRV